MSDASNVRAAAVVRLLRVEPFALGEDYAQLVNTPSGARQLAEELSRMLIPGYWGGDGTESTADGLVRELDARGFCFTHDSLEDAVEELSKDNLDLPLRIVEWLLEEYGGGPTAGEHDASLYSGPAEISPLAVPPPSRSSGLRVSGVPPAPTLASMAVKGIAKVSPSLAWMARRLLEAPDPDVGDTTLMSLPVGATVRALAWHSSRPVLAVVLGDSSLRLYDATARGFIALPKARAPRGEGGGGVGQQRETHCVAWQPFSSGGLALGARSGVSAFFRVLRPRGGDTGDVGEWGSRSLAGPTPAFLAGPAPITTIAWHPEGRFLAAGSSDSGTTLVWDLFTLQSMRLFRLLGGVTQLRWSPDGARLLACDRDAPRFRVWRTARWECELWDCPARGACVAGCWSPCGRVLVAACRGSTEAPPALYAIEYANRENARGEIAPLRVDLGDVARRAAAAPGAEVADLAWDGSGERLAVCWTKARGVALFSVRVHPALELSFLGCVAGSPGEVPYRIAFRPRFAEGALLALACHSEYRNVHDGASSVRFVLLRFPRADGFRVVAS